MAKKMEIFRRTGFDKPLALTCLILMSFGLIMVFSTSAVLSTDLFNRPFHFFFNQLIGALAGLLAVVILMNTPIPFYQNGLFIHGLLALTILLLAVALLMPTIGNTNRWIILLGIRFQPSELSKISLILYFAYFIDKKRERINEFRTLAPLLAVLGLVLFLIVKEPDYGTALLVALIAALMLFIGGLRLTTCIALGTAAAAFVGVFLLQASYARDRIATFINPQNDPLASGFQAIQSKLAVGAGGVLGVSLGESTQKLFFLPCAHTDYIYAIIGEELGFIGALGVLALFALFLWRGMIVSRKAPDLFTRLAAAGLTFAICTQALLNISIVLGLVPSTGLPLPLFSFGRSSLVMTLIGIAILLHISQRKAGQRRS